jgi:CheY-like chemotaxis protein
MTDITAQKQLEGQLIAARDKAQEADKLKSTFLANMSHEIRTPMNAIIGFLEFLPTEDDLDNASRKEYMRIVSDNANQLLKLIGYILDISKIDAEQMRIVPEPPNVNTLMQDIRSSFMASGAAGGKPVELLVIRPGDDEHDVFTVDSARLRQILSNLIGNALKFTDSGFVKYGYQVPPSGLHFMVEDTGIGISKEKLEDLGKPFHQLHAAADSGKYGGTGIGVAISFNLIKLMGGSYKVSSEVGKGSRFEFIIPCMEINGPQSLEDAITGANQAEEAPGDYTGRTFLIVEDMEASMGYLKTLLRHSNANILTAIDGYEGVEIVRNNPDIDMVLMDVRMPGMNGLEATMNIKEIRPDLPVIGQTAFTSEEDKDSMQAAGFDDWVAKPVNRPELTRKIRKHLK